MKKLCLLYQRRVAEHDFGPWHPLRKERLTLYIEQLHRDGLIQKLGIDLLDPEREVGEEDILAVHDISLIQRLKELSLKGGDLDADTPVPVGTYERAKLQAGGFLYGAELVMEGKYHRVLEMVAFGGHHAMRRHGPITFGFCYLNQESIVLSRLMKQGYISKAMVIDCDCHHGNGIQDIFYDNPAVVYISLHQDPRTLYPGVMGYAQEIGEGAGKGYNVNVPLPPLTTADSYLYAINEIFPPLAEEFKPEIILAIINADTHFKDPLTNMGLEVSTYGAITRVIASVANNVCGGKLLVKLGGGYDLKVAINSACLITAYLGEYYDYNPPDPYGSPPAEPAWVREQINRLILELKRRLAPYWACFKD